ncbi:toll/interleukin-1 receptor (TIR) domain-containing protein [Artemisia annua]|uniref:Toll/interleukin-1 receptor (TIR) domain-containing protein n=1 Tax=Artemisia annua TaxID=35608 RepID=A0A2U1P9U3_ARTAN|nr:toll/interleukin-1 receptor (TIR) domain-containing protein [Artemisia annua]
MASSSSSSSRSFKYDVFLSFRGEDTRKNFVDHLYTALGQRLIRTYKDDITLPRGESVGPALLEAIEESNIAVIVFSKNYADSSWCLDELVHIMKCREDMGLTVFPVFYDVDPSEVRYQKRKFGEAFSKQEMKNVTKAELWRKALVAASNISGWEPKNVANGHEAAVIQIIVDAISDNLLSPNSDIDEDEEFVGMRARAQDLIKSLEIGTGGVRMVGIWGVGGGGKTTLATSVYMKINHHFQGHCIKVDNIREESSKSGLKKLQEDILKGLLKIEGSVQNVDQIIRSRLRNSKVLILLDDVDDREQLQALVGSKKWFGDGSRIIITTRNEQLLKSHRVDYISQVRLLSHDEANQLLKRHAYNEVDPVKDYETLSSRVVSYSAGLPLALTVLGSFLYDKDEKEWMSTLDRLKQIPESEIVEKLKISYDGLKKVEQELFLDRLKQIPESEIVEKLKISYDGLKKVEQELFLDIACFFRGISRNDRDAMEILDACGFHPDIGIKVLIQKALITINLDGYFDMHDLVQEMAHYVVRGEHPDNPEKHSRVWKWEDINNLCIEDATTENDKIEAIGAYYQSPYMVPSPFFKFVSNLKKLRWILVSGRNDNNVEGPNFLSNELRYINWTYYPASPFPDSFQPMNLVVLKMNNSFQKELLRSHKRLPQLKVLQLSCMRKLVSTPNFDGLPCLQKLELRSCDDLEEIHPSIGNHRSLKSVKVEYCRNLRMFPTIFKMEKLELLVIRSHKSLEFPDIQANMESLVELQLNRNRFTEKVFPLLTYHLQRLDLVGCCLEDGEIPFAIGEMSNLQELRLINNNFSRLHFSISQLTRLKLPNLSGCKRLLELPQLPSSIAILVAHGCDSLTDVGDFYIDCKRLRYASLVCSNMVIDGNRFLQSMLEGETAENQCVNLRLQGLEIPKGFTPCLRKASKWLSECTLELPENWCSNFCGFLMCAVVGSYSSRRITIKQVTDGLPGMDSEDDVIWKESVGDEIFTWVVYFPFASLRHTNWWDSTHKKLWFWFSGCSGFGVRLVGRKGGSGPSEEISTHSSGISYGKDDYTTGFKIEHDSKDYLKISPRDFY